MYLAMAYSGRVWHVQLQGATKLLLLLALIKISEWTRKVMKIGEGISWVLKRCLPGQRAAARESYEHFRNILEELGFVCQQAFGTPSRKEVADLYPCGC